VIDRNIVDEGNIALDLFIDFTALCCNVEMIILVITGKPISMFKMVRQITILGLYSVKTPNGDPRQIVFLIPFCLKS